MDYVLAVDFSLPIFDEFFTGVLYDHKMQNKVHYWVFLDIFSLEIWSYIGLAVIVLTGTFVAYQAALTSEQKYNMFDTFCMVNFVIVQLGYDYKVCRGYLTILFIILSIYFGLKVKSVTTKLLLQMTCLFGIVIFASYEADLTTRMTIKQKAIPLRNFEDIYNSDKKIVVRQGNVQHDILMNAEEGSSLNKIYMAMDDSQVLDLDCKSPCLTQAMKVIYH